MKGVCVVTAAIALAGCGGEEASTGVDGGGADVGGNEGPPDLDGLDLTLGGLNADLAPSDACLSEDEPDIACMSVIVVLGEARYTGCSPLGGGAGYGGGYLVTCEAGLEGALQVDILIGSGLVPDAPGNFSFASPPAVDESTSAGVLFFGDAVTSPSAFRFDETKSRFDTELRVTGSTWFGPGTFKREPASRFIRGVFAATATPTASCSPEEKRLPCLPLRFRAVFTARFGPY